MVLVSQKERAFQNKRDDRKAKINALKETAQLGTSSKQRKMMKQMMKVMKLMGKGRG